MWSASGRRVRPLTGADRVSAVLVFIHLLAAAVWVGGFVAIVVVVRAARESLEPDQRVAFFRALGRGYGIVGGIALLVALATGAVLLAGRDGGWDAAATVAAVLGAAIVLATAAGVRQARAMTRLRQAALAAPGDESLARRIDRDSRRAAVLRAGIGILTIALLAVGAAIAA